MRLALTYNELRNPLLEEEAEFDTLETVRMLTKLLKSLGHIVVAAIDVSPSKSESESIPRLIQRLKRLAPDLVFNIAEGKRGPFREAFYPALFEQLGIPHTGSSASAIALCLDKALTKRVVAGAGVLVPHGLLVRHANELRQSRRKPNHQTAYLVKPNYEGSSKGITQASVVRAHHDDDDDEMLLEVLVRELLERYPEGVLIEEYIEGHDVSVGFIDGLGILPPIGYTYEQNNTSTPVFDYALKQAPDRVRVDIPAKLAISNERVVEIASRAFTALDVRGFGRADFRVTPSGEVYFLEMNALPSLADEDLYLAAAAIGSSPREMIGCIVNAVQLQLHESAKVIGSFSELRAHA